MCALHSIRNLSWLHVDNRKRKNQVGKLKCAAVRIHLFPALTWLDRNASHCETQELVKRLPSENGSGYSTEGSRGVDTAWTIDRASTLFSSLVLWHQHNTAFAAQNQNPFSTNESTTLPEQVSLKMSMALRSSGLNYLSLSGCIPVEKGPLTTNYLPTLYHPKTYFLGPNSISAVTPLLFGLSKSRADHSGFCCSLVRRTVLGHWRKRHSLGRSRHYAVR